MKICFLIPDGVGIRNYLYSDVMKHLHDLGHEIMIWHSLDEQLIKKTEEINQVKVESQIFNHQPDSPLVQLIRESTFYARLRWNAKLKSNETILGNWNPKKNTFKLSLLFRVAGFIGRFLTKYDHITRLEKLGTNLLRNLESYSASKAFLSKHKPDILFCTHQRVPSVASTMLAAKDLGIFTMTSIFSWDNLPKGRLPFRADKYLVWSEYMKKELCEYYPEIPQDYVSITGTPQFDFYRNKNLIMNRANFATKYGLNVDKRWVCFSGSDSLTSPYDPEYLGQVAKALSEEEDIQLIFRKVPVETDMKFRKVLDAFPNIVSIDPEWVKGTHWGNYFPLYSDIKLLVNLVYHCPVVINVGSTMALDFAAFGNAGLYLNFDQENSHIWSVSNTYKFEHFRSMDGLNAVGWINSENDIKSMVRIALDFPEKVGPDKYSWFQRIVEPVSDRSSAERISALLETLDKKSSAKVIVS